MPRKKPFSSKQKRLQLQQKRHKKREREEGMQWSRGCRYFKRNTLCSSYFINYPPQGVPPLLPRTTVRGNHLLAGQRVNQGKNFLRSTSSTSSPQPLMARNMTRTGNLSISCLSILPPRSPASQSFPLGLLPLDPFPSLSCSG